MHRRVASLVVLSALAGCGAPSMAEHRQRWAAERQALDQELDDLEARLLADQARVRFWTEMRERHESVTAIACTNLGRHAEDMARLQGEQRQKVAATGRGKRVAQVAGVRTIQ